MFSQCAHVVRDVERSSYKSSKSLWSSRNPKLLMDFDGGVRQFFKTHLKVYFAQTSKCHGSHLPNYPQSHLQAFRSAWIPEPYRFPRVFTHAETTVFPKTFRNDPQHSATCQCFARRTKNWVVGQQGVPQQKALLFDKDLMGVIYIYKWVFMGFPNVFMGISWRFFTAATEGGTETLRQDDLPILAWFSTVSVHCGTQY